MCLIVAKGNKWLKKAAEVEVVLGWLCGARPCLHNPKALGSMTEYWVSQKQHFCEHCKIFIANNAASKGMHENGQRHKENVAKRLADMRRRNVVEKREKEQMDKDLERIEWKARRQYEKDLAQQSAAEPASGPAGKLRFVHK